MIATIAFASFGLTFVAAGIRAIRGPGIADRVAALDVAVISLMGAVAVETARTGSTVLLESCPTTRNVAGFDDFMATFPGLVQRACSIQASHRA